MNIELVASLDYGKFRESQVYSYLNWEPVDQVPIQEVSSVYLNSNLPHDAGFRFAINQDPAIFQGFIYLSNAKT